MLRHPLAVVVPAIAFLAIAVGAACAGPVDLFEDGPFHLQASDTSDTISQSGLDPATVLGGRRDVAINNANPSGTFAIAELNTTAGDDALVAQAQDGAAIALLLNYGLGGPLNADLSGFDAVSMFFDQLPTLASFVMEVDSGAGSGSAAHQSGSASGEVRFRFDDPGFANVSFNDVDAIRFEIVTDIEDHFALARITTSPANAIPLPPAVWSAAAAFAALLLAQHVPARRGQRKV